MGSAGTVRTPSGIQVGLTHRGLAMVGAAILVLMGLGGAWLMAHLRAAHTVVDALNGAAASRLALQNDADAPPRPADLALYHAGDEHFLREIIATVFPHGTAALSDEAKSVAVMRFVVSHIAIGEVERYKTSAEYIRDQAASCGGFAMAFSDLVRLLGVPARYLGAFGFSDPSYGVGSHALVEVFYDGSWHLFDPTFGVFFYSRATYDGQGRILSARELVTATTWPTVMQVVAQPWLKNYTAARHHPVAPVGDSPTSHVYSYWNRKNVGMAFPVAYGNASTVSFPVRADLVQATEFVVGQDDRSHRDIYLESAARAAVGYFYLGGQTPASVHTVEIGAPARALVDITYVAQDDDAPPLSIFPLDGLHVVRVSRAGRATTFRVLLNGTRGLGLVHSLGRLYWVDTMSIARVDGHAKQSTSDGAVDAAR
ncbi:MAG: transglutaminase family protein [Gammaproteobacteria bacterium]